MDKIYQKAISGGKNAGFTLIELLVVVLIVGVLAAVAVPQYQKAVDKAAISCIMPILRSLSQAQQAVALERGGFPKQILDDAQNSYFHFSDLPLSVPATNWEECKDTTACHMKCASRNFAVILRSRETWANFWWGDGVTMDRLVWLDTDERKGFLLECYTERCRKTALSFGGTACEVRGHPGYCF